MRTYVQHPFEHPTRQLILASITRLKCFPPRVLSCRECAIYHASYTSSSLEIVAPHSAFVPQEWWDNFDGYWTRPKTRTLQANGPFAATFTKGNEFAATFRKTMLVTPRIGQGGKSNRYRKNCVYRKARIVRPQSFANAHPSQVRLAFSFELAKTSAKTTKNVFRISNVYEAAYKSVLNPNEMHIIR